ncbi:MAG: valine--tRNA ligase [Deltaproteobacteria bacterium]|nr:valine--tRNA ligase [Deltaproteobacteria bacterium]
MSQRVTDTPRQLPKQYAPAEAEGRWYAVWEEKGYFRGDPSREGEPFSIVIPPPNVTGSLHIGHALNNTLQDVLVRWRRMQGRNVVWIPGTDHAGIATQNVVERQLAAEGINRETLGREKFVERVWEWKRKSGGRIIEQLKELGASCDWSRERFTMDEGLSRAVREVFARLYADGLIYRAASQLVNWCVRCHTALSDIEVEHRDTRGHLWLIRYPLEDGKGHVTVATTRPETMLGDVAVAVHPEDPRYGAYVGKRVVLPLVGRSIPIISDEYVDREMGTGALKITPGHDPNDFQVGKRHGLPALSILTVSGRINDAFLVDAEGRPIENARSAALVGLSREEARKRVVSMLEEDGLLERVDPHAHAVGTCYRCHTVIEPFLSPQWFVAVESLARPAITAVEEGRTTFHPRHWENTYFEWMRNIRDWCVSRQLWWGHRIPAWYCLDCDRDAIQNEEGVELRSDRIDLAAKPIVAAEDPGRCPRCGQGNLVQDPDVLDTWFSSALWPFSTMGWPEETPELRAWYPTGALVTSFDIIFFWVARMMMMGLRFRDDVPFRDVYIHALVRTETGEKMSKSKGNVIDPLVISKQFGADAFRFTLTALAAQGRDIRISEKRIEGYRNFVNKIWNAARFALMNLEDHDPEAPAPADLAPADRWVLRHLGIALGEVDAGFSSYRFNDAALALYQFIWNVYCDWYIELAKPALADPERRAGARHTLLHVLKEILKALHPVMPFVTEELWSALPRAGGEPEHVAVAPYPAPFDAYAGDEEVAQLDAIIEAITRIRNVRGEMGVPPGKRVEVFLLSDDDAALAPLKKGEEHISRLGGAEKITFGGLDRRPSVSSMAVAGKIEVHVALPEADRAGEAQRLEKSLAKLQPEIAALEKKLENPAFVDRAPREVVAEARGRHAAALETRAKLEEGLAKIRNGGAGS